MRKLTWVSGSRAGGGGSSRILGLKTTECLERSRNRSSLPHTALAINLTPSSLNSCAAKLTPAILSRIFPTAHSFQPMKLQDYDTGIGGSTTTISPLGSPQPTYRGAGSTAAAAAAAATATAAATAKTNGYYMQVRIGALSHSSLVIKRICCTLEGGLCNMCVCVCVQTRAHVPDTRSR